MRKSLFFLTYIFLPFMVVGQSLSLMTPLSDTVSESSSLIYINQKLITNNDSGGQPELYEIDSLSGNVIRTVAVANAENVDWEALCYDSNYIYIGDFGNNNGNRTDLKIYRISQNDYFNTLDNTVNAEVISFHYGDQTDFSSTPFQTNFDAEAFIALGDSLYIFTKNWGDNHTNIYPISKLPGNYELTETDNINTQGLVTGATYIPESGTILLSGYTLGSPFAFRISDFTNSAFSEGTLQPISFQVPTGYSYQIEGVTAINSTLIYFTSEAGFAGVSGLFKMHMGPNSIVELNEAASIIYPNPAMGSVTIRSCKFGKCNAL